MPLRNRDRSPSKGGACLRCGESDLQREWKARPRDLDIQLYHVPINGRSCLKGPELKAGGGLGCYLERKGRMGEGWVPAGS